jgi:hypothetical protein
MGESPVVIYNDIAFPPYLFLFGGRTFLVFFLDRLVDQESSGG